MIEYKIIRLEKSHGKVEEELNNLSRQGWRIVCSCGKHNRSVILKKKITERIRQEDYEE